MKTKLIASSLLALLSFNSDALEQKVLLIGIDGVQFENIAKIHTPGFDRLTTKKAYTGGITGTQSQQDTKSGPGWATILTGVWANKHQVTSNSSNLADNQFASVFRHIKNSYPTADISSFSTWAPIHSQFFKNDLALLTRAHAGGTDETNFNLALDTLKNHDPDFIFLHLDEPDVIAHSQCFSGAYNDSIQKADSKLNVLLDEIQKRQSNSENWLVLVTTDHGRTPISGCHHGNQTRQEKTIFISSNQTLNDEFSNVVTSLPNQSFDNLYGTPSQAAITPTILRFMGIEPKVSDNFDSTPLIGELGVQKIQKDNTQFKWHADDSGNVTVFRNEVFVETLSAQQNTWQDDVSISGKVDYVFEKNKTPVGYRTTLSNLVAAHQWYNSKTYFFDSNATYTRYNKILDKADSGYPAEVNNHNWPGLEPYNKLIRASFLANNNTVYYFLSDGTFINYDTQADKVRDGFPKIIDESTWPGLQNYAKRITAALKWQGERVYLFLNDGTYLRINLSNNTLDSGYPKTINNANWPGLEPYAKNIQSALKWDDTRGYLFLNNAQYIRYNITLDKVDSGYPKAINQNTWPGLNQ